METNQNTLNKTARLAGLLYFLWVITGLFSLIYVPSKIMVRGDAVATTNNILAHETLFRVSILNDILCSIIWVYIVLVLYRLFKHVNEHQAKLLFALVIVQIPVSFMMDAFNITSLMLCKGEILKSFELAQRQDLAMLFLKINDYGTLALETFWGLWLFPFALLVYKSGFIPRFLGIWLFVNGIAYLALSFTNILIPAYADIITKITLPAMFGELAITLWLLIRGAKYNTPPIQQSLNQ